MIFTLKIRKFMWITTLVIIALTIFAFLYMAYDNLNEVRKSTNELDKGIDEIIYEWAGSDIQDQQTLDSIEADLKASEIKIDAMYKEAMEKFND